MVYRIVVIWQPTSVPVTPDVCSQSAPVRVTPEELKLDLSSLSAPPVAAERSRSSPPPAYVPPSQSNSDEEDVNDAGHSMDQQQPAVAGPLRDHIASMAKRFVDDGRAVRRSVLEHLHRFCRPHFYLSHVIAVVRLDFVSSQSVVLAFPYLPLRYYFRL